LRGLDFLRVCSIALVVLGHTLVFNVVFFDNPLDVLRDTSSSAALFLTVAALGFRAVDTFFFLGALLFAFVATRKLGPEMRYLSLKGNRFVGFVFFLLV
jgi:peptidoglycan/LPS O-acetylase OafA/YrhL